MGAYSKEMSEIFLAIPPTPSTPPRTVACFKSSDLQHLLAYYRTLLDSHP